MKTLFSTAMLLILFLIVCTNGVKAQTTQNKLNQVELMKQFLGSWKCNASKDSVETWVVKPFGKGYELHATGVSNDKTYFELKDLWGFNSKSETWMIFTLQSEGSYETYYGNFISNNELVWEGFDISNPEKITGRFGAFFNTPDKWTFIVYTDGKKSKELTFNRIK
jgi:hypothetical protein